MTGARLRRVAGTTAIFTVASVAMGVAPALGSNLTYSPSSFGSQINVNGDANDDNVGVSLAGNTVTVTDTGTGGITTADPDCAPAGPTAVTCPFDPPDPAPPAEPTGPVRQAVVTLQAGNDSATGSAPFAVILNGGLGDDMLQGGPVNDSVNGGSGNDTLLGGDGPDNLNDGGTGSLGGGTDLVDGQGGFDHASMFRELAVNVSLNGQPDDGFPGENDNVITESVSAGNGDDVLTGDSQANRLLGNGGNDLLTGFEGNDTLQGSEGDDGLIGGPQKDKLECAANFDTGVVEPRDVVQADCERTGAEVGQGSAIVNRKRRAKVPVNCPAEEANQCVGAAVVLAGARQLGAGSFSIAPGASGVAAIRLSKQGAKTLAGSGGALLVNVQAHTTEPIGTSIHEGGILLRAKGRGGGG